MEETTTEFDTTLVTLDEHSVGHIVLNRPDSLNALNEQLREDFIESFRWLEEHGEEDGTNLRAVIVEGQNDNFCAGADIFEFEDRSLLSSSSRNHYEFIREFPVPVIAKIRGYCLGGGMETAFGCDFRFAHVDATFGFPEVNLGINPGAGGVQFVTELTNASTAMELAMTGKHVDADSAQKLGLVNHVREDDLDSFTTSFAQELASKPPLAVQAIKRSARFANETGVREGIKHDQEIINTLRETEDYEKAIRAYEEDDYDPEFTGE